MATRTIKTRFELDGDALYKASIADINRGISVLNSEMRKCTAEFADNANGVEALTEKNDILERKLLSQIEKVEELKKAVADSASVNGESAQKTQEWQIKLNDAEAAVAKTKNAINENNEALKKAQAQMEKNVKILGPFQASTLGLGDALDDLTEKFGIRLPDGVKKAMNSFINFNPLTLLLTAGFTGLAAAVFAAEKKLISIAEASADEVGELAKLGAQLGLTVPEMQALEYACDQLHIPITTVRNSIRTLTNHMYDAMTGSEEMQNKFRRLGVEIENTDGSLRSGMDVWYDVIAALGQMDDKTARNAKAMEFLGTRSSELFALLDDGGEHFRGLADEAQNAGYVLSDEAADVLKELDGAFKKFETRTNTIKQTIGAEFAPYLKNSLEKVADAWSDFGDAMVASGIPQRLGELLDLLTDLLPKLSGLFYVLDDIMRIADGVATGIGKIADAYGRFSDKIGGSGSLLGDLWNSTKSAFFPAAGKIDVEYTGKGLFNAGGTANFVGGLTSVSENGGEDVILPRGTRILTAQESRENRKGGNTYVINAQIDRIETFEAMIRWFETRQVEGRMA